jgi:hypothetical protein
MRFIISILLVIVLPTLNAANSEAKVYFRYEYSKNLTPSSKLVTPVFSITPEYSKAYMEILRLRFNNAKQIISSEKKKSPGNTANVYLDAYMDFLKVIISEQEKDYDALLSKKSSRLKQIEAISKKSPWRLYAQAQMNLQTGIASVKAGDYFKAAVDINKAYDQFDENKKLFPAFMPNKAGLGLLHVLIGTVPDSYKWVTGLFGMEGDVKLGLKELQDLLNNGSTLESYPYLYYETLFLTTFITFNLSVGNLNTSMLNDLIENEKTGKEINSSPLLIYAVSSFYSNKGMNDKALKLLIQRPKDESYYSFHYLDFLTGVALLNKLDSKARVYFLKYVTNFKGSSFIKTSYQRLAWSYLVVNDLPEYKKYLSRVKIFGNDEMDHDKEAIKEAIANLPPHAELLKVRLLFDGGYYNRAEVVLEAINEASLDEIHKVEYMYRRARLSHMEGNIEQAKEEYNSAYRIGKGIPLYYAANSLLNLGNIYEGEGKDKEALWCYRECLKLDFDQYKTSIHQKAKAGISRISK